MFWLKLEDILWSVCSFVLLCYTFIHTDFQTGIFHRAQTYEACWDRCDGFYHNRTFLQLCHNGNTSFLLLYTAGTLSYTVYTPAPSTANKKEIFNVDFLKWKPKYEKKMCRKKTTEQQMNNTRSNQMREYTGASHLAKLRIIKLENVQKYCMERHVITSYLIPNKIHENWIDFE